MLESGSVGSINMSIIGTICHEYHDMYLGSDDWGCIAWWPLSPSSKTIWLNGYSSKTPALSKRATPIYIAGTNHHHVLSHAQ